MIDTYDIFIFHASEDKDSFVAPLAELLRNQKIKVWYDEFTLKVGDSLSRTIDRGLAKSKYGAVVLSPAFLAKGWPEYELRGLNAREIGGRKVILPIWHGITRTELLVYSPSLADKFALDTSKYSISEVAVQLIEVVRPDIFENLLRLQAWNDLQARAETRILPIEQLSLGPIRHESLAPSLRIRIKTIHSIFADVHAVSLEKTINNFQRDLHPEQEVEVWERMATVYLDMTRNKSMSLESKEEIFERLLIASTVSDAIPEPKSLKHISYDDAKRVLDLWHSPVPSIPDPKKFESKSLEPT